MLTALRCWLFPSALSALLAAIAAAQCEPRWLPGDPIAVSSGLGTETTIWDPDGAGPAAALLVVVGTIHGGAVAGAGVAGWDGSRWLALGRPPVGEGVSATVFNGALVVAFRTPGSSNTLASWDGTTWQVLGTFVSNPNTFTTEVVTLAAYQGSLYAGGTFTHVDGVPVSNIARWNGSAWSAVGAGQPYFVSALAVYANVLYAASNDIFATSGTLTSWNGTSWSNVASSDGRIYALAVRTTTSLPSSLLFASGAFSQWTGANGTIAAQRVASYSATSNTWVPLGSNLSGACVGLTVRSTGIVGYALVVARNDTAPNAGLWQWNGSTWVQLGPPMPNPTNVAYYGGAYHVLTGPASGNVMAARLLAGAWDPLNQPSTALGDIDVVLDAGAQVVVGGAFGIRQGNPGAWSPVGGLSGTVTALARLPGADLLAAGDFAIPGNASAFRIARWNGVSWSSLTTSLDGIALCLLPLPNGELIAGGEFTSIGGVTAPFIARWTGTTWQPLGGGVNARVRALSRLPSGEIVAGGDFTLAGSLVGTARNVARWDGSNWLPMSLGIPVIALATRSNGELVALTPAITSPATSAYRWSPGAWTPLPDLSARPVAMLSLPDGDLVFGGGRLTRWPAATAMDFPAIGGSVRGLAFAARGELLVVGDFDGFDGLASVGFARLSATCPASSVVAGAGCTGSAGPATLTALALPWTGATFRASATGLPAQGSAILVTGFSPTTLPLNLVFGTALPGCTLHVSPDLAELRALIGGTLAVQLTIPDVVALAGAVLHHQVIGLRTNAAMNITEVTASNSLRSVVGVF